MQVSMSRGMASPCDMREAAGLATMCPPHASPLPVSYLGGPTRVWGWEGQGLRPGLLLNTHCPQHLPLPGHGPWNGGPTPDAWTPSVSFEPVSCLHLQLQLFSSEHLPRESQAHLCRSHSFRRHGAESAS